MQHPSRIATRHIVLGAVMAMVAIALVAPHAHAESGSMSASARYSSNGGGGGNNYFSQRDSRDSVNNLKEKIAKLESQKKELLKRLENRTGSVASSTISNSHKGKGSWVDKYRNCRGVSTTTPGNKMAVCDRDKDDDDDDRRASSTDRGNRGPGDWKHKYCNPIGIIGTSTSESRKNICDRWDRGSTTPIVRPCNSKAAPFLTNGCRTATTTPAVKVLHPNGGKYYKRPSDGAILIKWRNTTKDKTVDIDLKTGTTTKSIAKDVSGRVARDGRGSVLGVSTSSNGWSGDRNDRYWKNNPRTFVYRWADAPIGEGYKIVVSSKVGSTTYSDESDATFSVVKNPRGKRWIEPKDDAGAVLGASTSEEDEMNAVLDQLEDTLAEMIVALDPK